MKQPTVKHLNHYPCIHLSAHTHTKSSTTAALTFLSTSLSCRWSWRSRPEYTSRWSSDDYNTGRIQCDCFNTLTATSKFHSVAGCCLTLRMTNQQSFLYSVTWSGCFCPTGKKNGWEKCRFKQVLWLLLRHQPQHWNWYCKWLQSKSVPQS